MILGGRENPFSSSLIAIGFIEIEHTYRPTFTGWWFQPTPSEKYEFVSWDDEIPNIWRNK